MDPIADSAPLQSSFLPLVRILGLDWMRRGHPRSHCPADMCELARNSCLQSGFEMEVKRHWLGPNWFLPGVEGNEIHKSNVPNIRIDYRQTTLLEEMAMVRLRSRPGNQNRC